MDRLLKHVQKHLFGSPLVDNRFRPLLVEAMVDMAISADWEWCAMNWSGHDFQHKTSHKKLEVKQSACRQPWHTEADDLSKLQFDISKRKGYFEGNQWRGFETERRVADIYLFAAHERHDAMADHRLADQWRFFVVRESDLPDRQTIRLADVEQLSGKSLSINEVRDALASHA